MLFKQLVIFQYPKSTKINFEELEKALSETPLKPVGPLEMESEGFVPALGKHGSLMLHQQMGCALMCLGKQQRLLPASVVNELLEQKLDEVEQQTGRRPSGKAKKALKDELIQTLLPKTFIKTTKQFAYIDTKRNLVFVNAGSTKSAEGFISLIRRALGSFPATPIQVGNIGTTLTYWLKGENIPQDMVLSDFCELTEGEQGAVLKASKQELVADEIQNHLEAGKYVKQLGLVFQERLNLVLTDGFGIKKLGLVEKAEETGEAENPAQLMDAEMAILVAEVGILVDRLMEIFEVKLED